MEKMFSLNKMSKPFWALICVLRPSNKKCKDIAVLKKINIFSKNQSIMVNMDYHSQTSLQKQIKMTYDNLVIDYPNDKNEQENLYLILNNC